MDQTLIVPASARQARRTAAKPTLRDSVERHEPKKARKNGMVVSTILFDPQMDEQLSALAFAWTTDRSALARKLIAKGLERYDVAEEVRKAAERLERGASVESDETMDRHSDEGDSSREEIAA
jgi:hypothetical protein